MATVPFGHRRAAHRHPDHILILVPTPEVIRAPSTDVAEGSTSPGYVLTMWVDNATATAVGVVGPADAAGDDARAILLNAPDGPPPLGFYASTQANRYSLPSSWMGTFCVGSLLSRQPISVALAQS
jgi:hypothetical protein